MYILFSTMGANPQPVLKPKSQNVLISKPAVLKSSPSSTKIVMKKVQPLIIEDEAIMEED
jgi:hypothetical protein